MISKAQMTSIHYSLPDQTDANKQKAVQVKPLVQANAQANHGRRETPQWTPHCVRHSCETKGFRTEDRDKHACSGKQETDRQTGRQWQTGRFHSIHPKPRRCSSAQMLDRPLLIKPFASSLFPTGCNPRFVSFRPKTPAPPFPSPSELQQRHHRHCAAALGRGGFEGDGGR